MLQRCCDDEERVNMGDLICGQSRRQHRCDCHREVALLIRSQDSQSSFFISMKNTGSWEVNLRHW